MKRIVIGVPRTVVATALWLIVLVVAVSFKPLKAQQDSMMSDKDMKLVDFEDMNYPAPGRTAHIQGVVVVKVKLDDQGKVVDATAVSGAEALTADCLVNAKKWRFQPNAHRAAVIVYNFRLTDTISKSGCSHFALRPPNFATITSCVPEIQ